MTLSRILAVAGPLDVVALALCLAAWAAVGCIIDYPRPGRPSVTVLMAQVRRDWMAEFVRREMRIFDATLVTSLRQGTACFASTSLIAVGAVPADPDDPRAPVLAAKAGDLNIRAAVTFNRGLGSMYFALGSLAWLFGPWALIAATVAVVWLLWSREFASHLLAIIKAPVAKE